MCLLLLLLTWSLYKNFEKEAITEVINARLQKLNQIQKKYYSFNFDCIFYKIKVFGDYEQKIWGVILCEKIM